MNAVELAEGMAAAQAAAPAEETQTDKWLRESLEATTEPVNAMCDHVESLLKRAENKIAEIRKSNDTVREEHRAHASRVADHTRGSIEQLAQLYSVLGTTDTLVNETPLSPGSDDVVNGHDANKRAEHGQ